MAGEGRASHCTDSCRMTLPARVPTWASEVPTQAADPARSLQTQPVTTSFADSLSMLICVCFHREV